MPDRPTADDLATWRRLADAATKGPWYTVDSIWLPPGVGTYVVAGHHDPHVGTPILDHVGIEEWDADTDGPNYDQSWADLEFAAAARTAVPALLAEVERLTTESADLLVYLNDAHARTDGVVKQRIHSDAVRAAVEARLVAIWPLARAALRLTSRNRAWDQVLDDDTMAAGEQFAAHITGYHTAWEELRVAAGALDPALRAELEARDDH
jgi:hypothetical protein